MECYFCGGEVTGVEHIPPRCFFPKGNRQDLITVPSCDIHNQNKSREDEYMRAILLSSINVDGKNCINELRKINARTLERGVQRAFESEISKEKAKKILEIIARHEDDSLGAPKAIDEIVSNNILSLGLLGLLNKGAEEISVTDNKGTEVLTTTFLYDKKRFDIFFESMARGIFFHEIGKRWPGKVNILPHTFLKNDAPQLDKDLSHRYLKHLDLSKSKGANKDIFFYEGGNEISHDGKKICIFFNFCIYDTFYFTAIFPF